MVTILVIAAAAPLFAETEVRSNLEFYNTVYRGRDNS